MSFRGPLDFKPLRNIKIILPPLPKKQKVYRRWKRQTSHLCYAASKHFPPVQQFVKLHGWQIPEPMEDTGLDKNEIKHKNLSIFTWQSKWKFWILSSISWKMFREVILKNEFFGRDVYWNFDVCLLPFSREWNLLGEYVWKVIHFHINVITFWLGILPKNLAFKSI